MEQRYNIYFAGQLLDGHESAAVRERLARLFKANDQVLDKLFSGKPQLLKKSCDKATALKYKQAMEKAGARPIVKAAEAPAQAPAAAPPEPAPAPAPAKTMTAAERIAAVAAGADTGEPRAGATDTRATQPDDAINLAPAGTDVLRPEERPERPSREIDTSGLAVDAAAQRLSEEPPPPPPAPDTSHLQMGQVGDDIPTLPSQLQELDPDTSGLDLSPEGTDFSDCAEPEALAPELDLSAIDLAPEGAEVLPEQYRKVDSKPAPDTGHITLSD